MRRTPAREIASLGRNDRGSTACREGRRGRWRRPANCIAVVRRGLHLRSRSASDVRGSCADQGALLPLGVSRVIEGSLPRLPTAVVREGNGTGNRTIAGVFRGLRALTMEREDVGRALAARGVCLSCSDAFTRRKIMPDTPAGPVWYDLSAEEIAEERAAGRPLARSQRRRGPAKAGEAWRQQAGRQEEGAGLENFRASVPGLHANTAGRRGCRQPGDRFRNWGPPWYSWD